MKAGRTTKSFSGAILTSLISLFIAQTQSLAFTPSLSLTVPTNLTGLWPHRHCVSNPTWNPPALHIASSCENALVSLSDDASTYGLHPGTFTYNPGGRSTADFPGAPSPLILPKRYVSGECVVAIVMMKMFERSSTGQFPGLPDRLIGRWPPRDTSTWNDLLEPVEYVRATCQNGCGYVVLGRVNAIGLAIWRRGSQWDQYARDISSLGEAGDIRPVSGIGNTSIDNLGNGSVLEVLR